MEGYDSCIRLPSSVLQRETLSPLHTYPVRARKVNFDWPPSCSHGQISFLTASCVNLEDILIRLRSDPATDRLTRWSIFVLSSLQILPPEIQRRPIHTCLCIQLQKHLLGLLGVPVVWPEDDPQRCQRARRGHGAGECPVVHPLMRMKGGGGKCDGRTAEGD